MPPKRGFETKRFISGSTGGVGRAQGNRGRECSGHRQPGLGCGRRPRVSLRGREPGAASPELLGPQHRGRCPRAESRGPVVSHHVGVAVPGHPWGGTGERDGHCSCLPQPVPPSGVCSLPVSRERVRMLNFSLVIPPAPCETAAPAQCPAHRCVQPPAVPAPVCAPCAPVPWSPRCLALCGFQQFPVSSSHLSLSCRTCCGRDPRLRAPGDA